MTGPENWFEPSPRKTLRIGLPKSFQYSLIWTLFFSIIGIFIQFMETKVFSFPQTINDFYVTNYSNWFSSFGNFTAQNFYYSKQDLINSLIGHWYYFFLTGGLISLIWGILSWIIRLEANFNLPPREEKIAEEKVKQADQRARINRLIAEGMKSLAENNQKQAEAIYLQAKQEYDSKLDPLKESYDSLLNFYQEILKNRKN